MPSLTAILSAVIAAYLASFVEVVEAFTIVLAVGLTRSWRAALTGAGLALVALAVMVVVFGPAIALVPIHALQFAVGTLLLLFGMRWLEKAILRARGVVALHDEDAAFAEETDVLRKEATNSRADYLAGLTAFKGVMLEGIEVVFIVIAVGTVNGLTLYASAGAFAAALTVVAIGAAVRRPLSRVPENTLKLVVGLMLTSFGIFWAGEGLGADWPGADLSLVVIFTVLLATALGLMRRPQPAEAVR